MMHLYAFEGTENIPSPALIYYPEIIKKNLDVAIKAAHGAERLWPHIKSHKMKDVVKLSMEYGITRFKCATLAEAEITAECGAEHIVLAYPLVGPNIQGFISLTSAFPNTKFYAIGDDLQTLSKLGETAISHEKTMDVLIDVNVGMNRTGVSLEKIVSFYDTCSNIDGIQLQGLHCYDGHCTSPSLDDRNAQTAEFHTKLHKILGKIRSSHSCQIVILGGSPSFPCHIDFPEAYFSPGTVFIYDYGYAKKYPDLPYIPAAAILTRVISCPGDGIFTLDLGYKGIAADPAGSRGIILGLENYEEMFHSEEHWTFCMKKGYEHICPKVGDEFFVIPTHICPTSALYSDVITVENKKITGTWNVSARNRKINY